MATEVHTDVYQVSSNLPKRAVQADGIFQMGVGLGVLLENSSLANWLNVNAEVVLIVAAVAVVSGIGTLYLAQRSLNPKLLLFGAISNLVGVVLVGIVLALDWNNFLNEGRWFLAFLADAFLILGVAEFYVRRYVA